MSTEVLIVRVPIVSDIVTEGAYEVTDLPNGLREIGTLSVAYSINHSAPEVLHRGLLRGEGALAIRALIGTHCSTDMYVAILMINSTPLVK